VEVRGLPETRHMLVFISERMNKVRDLATATKLKFVCSDIKKTDEIKIYRDKFLLPDNENINIIETDEEIIVYRKATETEYVEKKEDKNELLNVRDEVLKAKEDNLDKRETELKVKEGSLQEIGAILKKKEEDLKEKKDDFENRSIDFKSKEEILEIKVKEFQWKENEMKIKEEELSKKSFNLKSREEMLETQRSTIEQLKKVGQTMCDKLRDQEQKVHVLEAQLEASLKSTVSSFLQNPPLEATVDDSAGGSQLSSSDSSSSSSSSQSEDEIVATRNRKRKNIKFKSLSSKQIKHLY